MNQIKSVNLPHNRRQAYAEYGDPSGEPLIYLHGYPMFQDRGTVAGPPR
ncbi:MAG: hypothetical protein QNJ78_14320 [Gammaproteobacteria bacterium]|nr:hypothetical protein [Gammaproteobacteria bacterium]